MVVFPDYGSDIVSPLRTVTSFIRKPARLYFNRVTAGNGSALDHSTSKIHQRSFFYLFCFYEKSAKIGLGCTSIT